MAKLTATEVARAFSDVLNRVAAGEEIEIVRNGATVALLGPPRRRLLSAGSVPRAHGVSATGRQEVCRRPPRYPRGDWRSGESLAVLIDTEPPRRVGARRTRISSQSSSAPRNARSASSRSASSCTACIAREAERARAVVRSSNTSSRASTRSRSQRRWPASTPKSGQGSADEATSSARTISGSERRRSLRIRSRDHGRRRLPANSGAACRQPDIVSTVSAQASPARNARAEDDLDSLRTECTDAPNHGPVERQVAPVEREVLLDCAVPEKRSPAR